MKTAVFCLLLVSLVTVIWVSRISGRSLRLRCYNRWVCYGCYRTRCCYKYVCKYEKRSAPSQDLLPSQLHDIDTDSDGQVTLTEFADALGLPEDRAAPEFAKADTNSDGVLVHEDFI